MHLQNAVMQLRKVCSHPFLFEWPIDLHTHDEVVNDELVNASGKMLVLNRLLDELFRRDHKVLIFSQFTTMLNIIEVSFLSQNDVSDIRLNSFCVVMGDRIQGLEHLPH